MPLIFKQIFICKVCLKDYKDWAELPEKTCMDCQEKEDNRFHDWAIVNTHNKEQLVDRESESGFVQDKDI